MNPTDIQAYPSCISFTVFFTALFLAAGVRAGTAAAALYSSMPAGWLCDAQETVRGVHIPGMRPQAAALFSFCPHNMPRLVNPSGCTQEDMPHRIYEASFFCAAAVSLLLSSRFSRSLSAQTECAVSVLCLTALAAAVQSDVIYQIIPDQVSLFLTAAGLLSALCMSGGTADGLLLSAASRLSGGIAALLTMLAAALFSLLSLRKEGIGMGDIKLITACGIFLGIGSIFQMIFLSSLLCVLSAFRSLLSGRGGISGSLPMAPRIFCAFSVCLFAQPAV